MRCCCLRDLCGFYAKRDESHQKVVVIEQPQLLVGYNHDTQSTLSMVAIAAAAGLPSVRLQQEQSRQSHYGRAPQMIAMRLRALNLDLPSSGSADTVQFTRVRLSALVIEGRNAHA